MGVVGVWVWVWESSGTGVEWCGCGRVLVLGYPLGSVGEKKRAGSVGMGGDVCWFGVVWCARMGRDANGVGEDEWVWRVGTVKGCSGRAEVEAEEKGTEVAEMGWSLVLGCKRAEEWFGRSWVWVCVGLE